MAEKGKKKGMKRVSRGVPSSALKIKRRGRSLSPKQLEYLRVYGETYDMDKAAKSSGCSNAVALSEPRMIAEMEYADKYAMYSTRITSAAGRHMQLMDKFEVDYEGAEDIKGKSMMAGVLSRMSDSALRAAGEFSKLSTEGTSAATINIQINMHGEAQKKEEIIEVKARMEE